MEKKYIETNAFIAEKENTGLSFEECWWAIKDALESAPVADVVEVVRCGECKHWETEWSPNNAQFGEHFCPFIGINTAPDWFCADGQRREK